MIRKAPERPGPFFFGAALVLAGEAAAAQSGPARHTDTILAATGSQYLMLVVAAIAAGLVLMRIVRRLNDDTVSWLGNVTYWVLGLGAWLSIAPPLVLWAVVRAGRMLTPPLLDAANQLGVFGGVLLVAGNVAALLLVAWTVVVRLTAGKS